MISNIINPLNGQIENTLNNSNTCNCQSNNNAFGMIMISLLNAVSTRNLENTMINTNFNNNTLNVPLGLETMNTVQNTNKINPTNKDENVNLRINNAVKSAAKKYGVDENLIKAIIKVESNFNPNVTSTAGAKGLMQLMPFTYKEYGITNPYDIEDNIDGGTKHIKEYLNMYKGDVEMALMAYNGGCGRMAKRGVKSPSDIYKMPRETQNYVPKVMKYYKGQAV